MGDRFLLDLPAVLRAAGLQVVEEPGWQTRARSSGGYSGASPTHLMVHHTASGPSSDGQPDVDYCCYGSQDRPLANLYLNRAGVWWVMAAGATNTNGKGHDSWGGGVPDDSMNTYALAVEAANLGTGAEVWPQAQQRSYATGVAALRSAYAIPAAHVRGHFEWAPDRKVDPAGPSRWAAGGASWDMDLFRADVAGGAPPPTTASLTSELEEAMIYFVRPENERDTANVWASNVASKWKLPGNATWQAMMDVQLVRLVSCGMDPETAAGFNQLFVVDENTWRGYGLVVGPNDAGRDQWGWKD